MWHTNEINRSRQKPLNKQTYKVELTMVSKYQNSKMDIVKWSTHKFPIIVQYEQLWIWDSHKFNPKCNPSKYKEVSIFFCNLVNPKFLLHDLVYHLLNECVGLSTIQSLVLTTSISKKKVCISGLCNIALLIHVSVLVSAVSLATT